MRIVKLVLSIVGLAVIAWSIHHIGWAPVLEALARLTWWQGVLVCLPYAAIMAGDTPGGGLRLPRRAPPVPPLFCARAAGGGPELGAPGGSGGGGGRPSAGGVGGGAGRRLCPAAGRPPPRLLPPGLAATLSVDRIPPRRLAAGRGRGVPHPVLSRDLRRPRDRDGHRGARGGR